MHGSSWEGEIDFVSGMRPGRGDGNRRDQVENGEERGKNMGRDDLIILYDEHLLCVRHRHRH